MIQNGFSPTAVSLTVTSEPLICVAANTLAGSMLKSIHNNKMIPEIILFLLISHCHNALLRNVTICPLVQVVSGEKVVSDVPEVTPFSTAQATADAKPDDPFTSAKVP